MGLCWARARHSLKVTRLPVVRREGCSFQHSTDRQTDAGRAGRRWKGRLDYKGKRIVFKIKLMLQVFATKAVRT